MRGRLVVVAGTGTSIGKTHFAEALIRAWRRRASVVGLKPIESGLRDCSTPDAARLRAVSSFHVKQFGYALAAPLSPHLAARDEGIEIRIDVIQSYVEEIRQLGDGIVLELAGGLFSPLTDGKCNADLAKALAPEFLLLVAPDSLGVLHSVAATTRAASAMSLPLDGIILVSPAAPDPSTGRNANEIRTVAGTPVLLVLPRESPAELSALPVLDDLAQRINEGSRVQHYNI